MSIPENLSDTVLASIADFVGADLAEITPETRLEEDLDLDSTDFVGILVELEKKFVIKLTEVKFSKLETVNALIEVVATRMEKNAA